MSLYLRGTAEHKQRHLPAMVRYEKIGSFAAITPWPATQGFRVMSVFEPAPTEANPDHKNRTGKKLVLDAEERYQALSPDTTVLRHRCIQQPSTWLHEPAVHFESQT
jgi:hypothetical protein